MPKSYDKIQLQLRGAKQFYGRIDDLRDGVLIYDFYNDFLSDKVVKKQQDNDANQEKFKGYLFRKYTMRKTVFNQKRIHRIYVIDSKKRYKQVFSEKSDGEPMSQWQKDSSRKKFFFLQKYLPIVLGILSQVQGNDSILTGKNLAEVSAKMSQPCLVISALFEADEQCAYLYDLIKKEHSQTQVYIVSEDGDYFFYQLPWITHINLDPNNQIQEFGAYHYFDLKKTSYASISSDLFSIFQDRKKLAFLKVFSGTKYFPRHKGVTLRNLIQIISRLRFEPSDSHWSSRNIKDNIYTVLNDYMFRNVSQIFCKTAEQEIIHWLCASVWNPYQKHFDYLDRDFAYKFMQFNLINEDYFKWKYSGIHQIQELNIIKYDQENSKEIQQQINNTLNSIKESKQTKEVNQTKVSKKQSLQEQEWFLVVGNRKSNLSDWLQI